MEIKSEKRLYPIFKKCHLKHFILKAFSSYFILKMLIDPDFKIQPWKLPA